MITFIWNKCFLDSVIIQEPIKGIRLYDNIYLEQMFFRLSHYTRAQNLFT
jgi:hypothetical protein